MQQALVYILLALAVGYLVVKFIIPRKKKKSGKHCDNCE